MKHILNILATWRLMELIRDEDAPYQSMKRFRDYIELHKATGGGVNAKQGIFGRFLDEVSEAIGCDWCLSIWCGLFVAGTTGENIVFGFAYSAGALLFKPLFTTVNRKFGE